MELLDKLNCDFCAHGDDCSISDETGEDVNKHVKVCGRYREFKRTRGVSTTDIVGRMLLLSRNHHTQDLMQIQGEDMQGTGEIDAVENLLCDSQYLSTLQICQLSSGKVPKPCDRIVYVSGAFDLMHIGHVKFLKRAAEEGDFLIVGLHTDQVVNKYQGRNYPIMNLRERVLCLLSCKYVSEVIIGAPYEVTANILDHFQVSVVCDGMTTISPTPEGHDPFQVARDRNIFKQIDSKSRMSTPQVVERIIANSLEYELRNARKEGRPVQTLKDGKIKNDHEVSG